MIALLITKCNCIRTIELNNPQDYVCIELKDSSIRKFKYRGLVIDDDINKSGPRLQIYEEE